MKQIESIESENKDLDARNKELLAKMDQLYDN